MTHKQQTLRALAGTPSQVAAMLTGSDATPTTRAIHAAYRLVRRSTPTMPAWAAWAYVWRLIRAGTFELAFLGC